MSRIDLITGFLGSGKTTFLKRYLSYLLGKGERIAVLEFDYGAVNVDAMLLQEFNGRVDLEMVAGGCDYACHLRRFKTKLIALGMKKVDRVIVEPSGLFDPDEFFDTLAEDPLEQWYEIGSVISIVDAGLGKDLSEDSSYILMSQIASSGAILLSKVQEHTQQEIQDCIARLTAICEKYHVPLERNRILSKPYDQLDKEDFDWLARASYEDYPHEKRQVMEGNDYETCYIMDARLSLEALKSIAKTLFVAEEFGHVLRLKGFVKENEQWYEYNATKEDLSIAKIPAGQDVLILIGENLEQNRLKSLFAERKK